MPSENAKAITPLFNTRMKDISITLGGNGCYYLTGTVIQQNPTGVLLWKSKDLKGWTELGVMYDDGDRLKAPEIYFIKNNCYIVIAQSDGCIKILKSKAQKVTRPYEASECLVENDTDPSLFVDDDNKVYLLYGNGYIA